MGVRPADESLCGMPHAWSQGTVEGAIQIPSDGQPIVLMTDHRSIGDCSLLGFVYPLDLSCLAQNPVHSEVAFIKNNLATQQADLLRFCCFFRS